MLTPTSDSYDHAYAMMTLDVVRAVLRDPEDLARVVGRLLGVIRELSGARTVIMCRFRDEQEESPADRLLGVNPERRRALAETPQVARLFEMVPTLSKPELWRPNAKGDEPQRLLHDLGVGLTVGLPLMIGAWRTGGLLVMEPTDDHQISAVVKILETLSAVVAPVLENSFLIERLKHSIDERMQAEKELARAKEAAETANHAKSVFLANMSHELRTPLNAILGFTQLMENDTAIPEVRREELAIIGRSGRHLLGLINDVLDIAKIEAGHIALTPTAFDLKLFIRGITEMFHSRARARNLDFDQHVDPELPQSIRSDEGKLRQVLINLLGNAVKFTEQGCVTFRALMPRKGFAEDEARDFGAGEATTMIRFEVEDTGGGIPIDCLEQVFDPFVQAGHHASEKTGTGLGLAISQQYVELMGGRIGVESELGTGSIFQCDISVELADADEIEEKTTAPRVIGLAPGQAQPCILIVEDREESRILLSKLLRSVGFGVIEATNGKEGVDLFLDRRPDLVWMDMRMPVMDGSEATQRIKETTQGAATPVIALTAHAFEEERNEFLKSGCDDFVRKPYQQSEIFEKMATHLGVQYVYEDEDATKTTSSAPQQLTPTDLDRLPKDVVEELHRSAVCGSIENIERLIAEIEPDEPDLAQALSDLTKAFDIEPIIEATSAPA